MFAQALLHVRHDVARKRHLVGQRHDLRELVAVAVREDGGAGRRVDRRRPAGERDELVARILPADGVEVFGEGVGERVLCRDG